MISRTLENQNENRNGWMLYCTLILRTERHPISTFCCIELDTVDSQSKLYQNLKMKMTSCSLKRGQVKILIEAAFIGLLYIEWLPKWPQEQPQVHSAIIHNLLQWGTLHVLFLKTSGSKTWSRKLAQTLKFETKLGNKRHAASRT